MSKADKELLAKFPKYDGKPEHWVGSREYWKSIFESETNRDPELHKAFGQLHHKIVNMVVAFCKEHDLNVDEVSIGIDGILGSKDYGEWTCFTDSSMSMTEIKEDEEVGQYWDREHPFLYEI